MRLLFDQTIIPPSLDDFTSQEQVWIWFWAYVLSDRGQRELQDIPEFYTRVYKELKVMLTPMAEKAIALGGDARIVYTMQVLSSWLPFTVVTACAEMYNHHEPRRRIRWGLFRQLKEAGVVSWSHRVEVDHLLDYIATADADPMGHAITLLHLRAESRFVPLVPHWCRDCSRHGDLDEVLQEAVEELGDRIQGPKVVPSAALGERAKQDILLVHYVIKRQDGTLGAEIREALGAGQRGRLFIQKRHNQLQAAWQSLQQVRRLYTGPIPSTDHTLEWIEQMPLDQVLVASVCDGYRPDPAVRTLCMPQPWLPIEEQIEMQRRFE